MVDSKVFFFKSLNKHGAVILVVEGGPVSTSPPNAVEVGKAVLL